MHAGGIGVPVVRCFGNVMSVGAHPQMGSSTPYFGGDSVGEDGDRMTVYKPVFSGSRSACSNHLSYMRFTVVHSLWFVRQVVISTAIRVRWEWDCCTRECIV